MSAIRTENLSVAFGQPVLRDVTVDIAEGDFVALMGANGTGKTTLVRAMLGLVKPDRGSAWLFDAPVAKFRQWQRVAYVPQRLLAHSAVPLSVEEAVRAALTSAHHRWRPLNRAEHKRVRNALDQVGLSARAQDRLEDLSGGQQRRVMIARALAASADLLLMDEPTAGIDAGEQERLASHVASLHAAGMTILLITHDVGPVARLAGRAIVLGAATGQSVRYDGPSPPPERWTEHVWHHSPDAPEGSGLLEGQ